MSIIEWSPEYVFPIGLELIATKYFAFFNATILNAILIRRIDRCLNPESFFYWKMIWNSVPRSQVTGNRQFNSLIEQKPRITINVKNLMEDSGK